eukprot:s1803_g10.t1
MNSREFSRMGNEILSGSINNRIIAAGQVTFADNRIIAAGQVTFAEAPSVSAQNLPHLSKVFISVICKHIKTHHVAYPAVISRFRAKAYLQSSPIVFIFLRIPLQQQHCQRPTSWDGDFASLQDGAKVWPIPNVSSGLQLLRFRQQTASLSSLYSLVILFFSLIETCFCTEK